MHVRSDSFIALLGFSILFRIVGALRLSIPLLYALIVPTVFQGWYYANTGLATSMLNNNGPM